MPRKKKLVLNHSTFIHGLRERLEVIQGWPEVHTVIPGHISSGARQQQLKIKVQRDTETGLMCKAIGSNAAQLFHIVTKERDAVRKRLESL